ncbi:Protodermal factor 2 isoform 1 [Hibiscus syriacus]|uniref:Protodermal factor 2 isoform 1 n=1 Tax=Hibiscus syriacus TaxID=106335 RepID=A0A6A3BQB4_HIBSY|nr:uncharacterized protein LOC120211949 [Hibiscus syriacus]KAE8718793.1 Protodermal factor 2 isoform 1 [Hibiscus syriacus]
MGKWRICCVVSALVLIISVVVLVTLYFTLFKPKDPNIIVQSVTLQSTTIRVVLFPYQDIEGNATIGLTVTVDNRNYGGFKYHNATAFINYRGNLVAEAPIGEDSISPRSKHNISTSVIVFAHELAADDHFLSDFFSGVFNFTSSTTLHGKVNVFNIFKFKASSSRNCNISVSLQNQTADSVCTSKIKF